MHPGICPNGLFIVSLQLQAALVPSQGHSSLIRLFLYKGQRIVPLGMKLTELVYSQFLSLLVLHFVLTNQLDAKQF